MNATPRALNRVLLALIGLALLLAGAGLVTLAAVPAAGLWWQGWAGSALAWLQQLAARTKLGPHAGSWVWLVAAAALVAVIVLMVAWIASQGRGRSNVLWVREGTADDDGAAGKVMLGCAVAEQTLKAALLERTDLVGVSVSSYDFLGRASLKVRVLPRQGVAPQEVAADIGALVEDMDALLGVQVPVLVSIGSGARARFTKAERVR